MIKKIQVQLYIKKEQSTKLVNRDNLGYLDKFTNHANPMKRENKR